MSNAGELGLLEKFIQHCHSKQEGLSDSYIIQTFNNMQDLLLVQFLIEELQSQYLNVNKLQKRVDAALLVFENGRSGCFDIYDLYDELEQALKGGACETK